MSPTIRRFLICAVLAGVLMALGPNAGRAEEHRVTLYSQVESLSELSRLVKRYYYQETDPVDLYHGAILGYLSELDPHSTYIPPEEIQDTQERLQGAFEGIGIFFEIIDNFLTVLSPIEGSPASQVGLRPGDRIVKIDGRSAVGIKSAEVTRRLKGTKGSLVRVSIQREGHDDLLEFKIVRDKIDVPSVTSAFKIRSDVGYVKITRFSERTGEELELALNRLRQQGIGKLILDLRNNGGGYLEQGVAVANQFVEKDRLLVYTEGRHPSSRDDHYAVGEPLIPLDLPLMVLVNGFSASASEIVAGAIQDYDRGLIVGHTTFGKGLVQKQYPLKNGGAVLLTVARYFTPSGRPIQRPFTDDRLTYLEAGYDDYDPNADPDSTMAKPIYYTRILHRKVFGSGGITPDVVLSRDSLSAFSRQLIGLHPSPLLEFATRYAAEVTRSYPEFDAFLKKYTPGRREISTFRDYLKSRNIAHTDQDIRESLDFIKGEIRRQTAQMRWGSWAEAQMRAYQDAQVTEAIAFFHQAKQLIADRIQQGSRGQSRFPVPKNFQYNKTQ